MNPMLDPDLIEYMDDQTLLAAFTMATGAGDREDIAAIGAEMARRHLAPPAPLSGLTGRGGIRSTPLTV